MPSGKYSLYLFLLTEFLIFFLFYSFLAFTSDLSLSGFIYVLYLIIAPVMLIATVLYDPYLREKALQFMSNRDWVILITGLFIWGYFFALKHLSPFYMFYEISFIDEINFRFVVFNYLCRYTRREYALIIQAALFMLLYMNYIFLEPQAYPGLYRELYIMDMFIMGILYGIVVYFRNSIYIDILIHLSLYDLVYFSPPVPGWIPYLMLPT